MTTYNQWLKTTLEKLTNDNKSSNGIQILNMGSGKRCRIEDVETADKKLLARVVNADWVTFKSKPDESNVLAQYSDNLDNMLPFLEGCKDQAFNHVISCRFFEHIFWNDLAYYLYQIYRITDIDGTLTFVVPDYNMLTLALKELEADFDYQKWITLNSEYFNCKEDSHCCLWTPALTKPLIEGEGYWKVTNIETNYEVDGRGWYMQVTAVKSANYKFQCKPSFEEL